MPQLLELSLNCEEYRALPFSGGVMEQPAGLMSKLRMVGNIYRAFQLYKSEGQKPGEAAKWKSKNEQVWNIVREVNELRKQYG
jgi:hypothetical protein